MKSKSDSNSIIRVALLKSLFNLWINIFLNQILDQANGIINVALASYGSFKQDKLGVQSPFSSALEQQGSDLRADPHASYQKEFLQVSHIESTSFWCTECTKAYDFWLNINIWFLKSITFYYLKNYFIYYTIPFYNTPNIPTFILPYNTSK